MQILMFVLMALSPTTSFASFLDTLSESTRLTMVGTMSSIVMLVRSIQNFWKLEEQAQTFKEAAHKFHEIHGRLKTQLTASANNRAEWDVFKDKTLDALMSIHSNAPTAPYKILLHHKIITNKDDTSSTSQQEVLMNEISTHLDAVDKKGARRNAHTHAVFEFADDDGGVAHDELEGTRTIAPPPTLSIYSQPPLSKT